MQPLVECVPNFSDGRNPEVYTAIADAIRAVRGTRVLNISADADHNRSVITFAGPPEAVLEGAFQAIATAARLINMDEHSGEHPRIGATDVCPFVPVRGVTMADCVALARRLGERVGAELDIPVYLYAEAATRPERVKLGDIRRGEYEKWREEVGKLPERQPDFGPAEPRTTGATVIGARPFLIAYNVYLNSDDVETANKIARAVRTSSGGLLNVQALGFLVEGQAQVSMNLLNFEKTPIYRVQEMVRREAARYGLAITRAELIGLVPQAALIDSARWYLQLDGLEEDEILEMRLAQVEAEESAGIAGMLPYELLEATAAGTPTPGGGAIAAVAGALGAALAGMVAGLTVGRRSTPPSPERRSRCSSRRPGCATSWRKPRSPTLPHSRRCSPSSATRRWTRKPARPLWRRRRCTRRGAAGRDAAGPRRCPSGADDGAAGQHECSDRRGDGWYYGPRCRPGGGAERPHQCDGPAGSGARAGVARRGR